MKPSTSFTLSAALAASASVVSAAVHGLNPSDPPHQSEPGQTGYNDCQKYPDSASSECQTLWVNSIEDFCFFAPPKKGEQIGDSEQYEVTYCTKAGHGARLVPEGTFHGLQMVKTEYYVEFMGTGDFTKVNVAPKDEGGELDPHGATGTGNPVGGVVFGPSLDGKSKVEFVEWDQFIAYNEFCLRACYPGVNATKYCAHVYDEMGCYYNMPGDYPTSSFETCEGTDNYFPGQYQQKNGTYSTFHQGQAKTPDAHPPPKTSDCVKAASLPGATYTSTAKTSSTTKKAAAATSTHKTTSTKKATSTHKATSTKKTTSTKKAAATSSKKVAAAEYPKVTTESTRQKNKKTSHRMLAKKLVAGDEAGEL